MRSILLLARELREHPKNINKVTGENPDASGEPRIVGHLTGKTTDSGARLSTFKSWVDLNLINYMTNGQVI